MFTKLVLKFFLTFGVIVIAKEQLICVYVFFIVCILQIAKDMASSTTDQLLKAEMPAYVQEVEDAGQMLMEAATDLKADQMSEPGKAKLLSGARGKIWMVFSL